jgi:hypothetical protein
LLAALTVLARSPARAIRPGFFMSRRANGQMIYVNGGVA